MAGMNLTQARLGINYPLSVLAQGYKNPEYVFKNVYPFVYVGAYGGQIISTDESIFEDDFVDDRADDTPYEEIDFNFSGKPFKLNTKGLRYRLGDKLRKETGMTGINLANMATGQLMNKAGLRHEITAATLANDPTKYATSNTLGLTNGNRFSDTGVNPNVAIQTGIDAVGDQVGVGANVAIIGRAVWAWAITKYSNAFVSTDGVLRPQLTEDALAAIWGLQKVYVCRALRMRRGATTKTRIMDKNIVLAYVNPTVMNSEGLAVAYRPGAQINVFEPNFGYTYVYGADGERHPIVKTPWYDDNRAATVYDMDFDHAVVNTGTNNDGLVTHGYLLREVVA